jgi:hypothetical protein
MSNNIRLPKDYFYNHLPNNYSNGLEVNTSRVTNVVNNGNTNSVNGVFGDSNGNTPINNLPPNFFIPRGRNNSPNKLRPLLPAHINGQPRNNRTRKLKFSTVVRERPINRVGKSFSVINPNTGVSRSKTRTVGLYEGNPSPIQSSVGLVNSAVSRAMGWIATNSNSLNAAKAKVKPNLLNLILTEQGIPKNYRKFTVTRHYPKFQKKLLEKLNRNFVNTRNNR